MKADSLSITEIINQSTLFEIPFYQRRYIWEELNWDRFYEDMKSTLDSDRKYFLGAIILKETKVSDDEADRGISNKRLVIDGQQRLTTLAIFMKLLYQLTLKNDDFLFQYMQPDKNNPVIVHSCEDRTKFVDIMISDAASEKKVDDGSKYMFGAYNFFLKKLIEDRNQGMSIERLLNRVKSKVSFVVITLNDEDNEQQIFDTINSLGCPLTTGDLVKNFLYTSNDQEAYRKNWKDVFDTDDAQKFWQTDKARSRQGKDRNNITIERFFHAFVRIKMWDFKLNEKQKKEFVKEDNVFETIKAFVNNFGMDRQDLANEIISYAKLYKEFLNSNIIDSSIPEYGCVERISCLINGTQNYAIVPYVLYILRNVASLDERNRIFNLLEIYLIRRMIAGSDNKSYSDLFSDSLINGKKNTYNSLKTYLEERKDSALELPSDTKIRLSVNSPKKLKENTARTILYFYETRISPTTNDSYNDFIAVQLMPEKDSNNWPGFRKDTKKEEERKVYANTIGNFFLEKSDGSRSLKKEADAPCSTKVSTMKDWAIGISAENLNGITDWNSDLIKTRSTSLASSFINRWSI